MINMNKDCIFYRTICNRFKVYMVSYRFFEIQLNVFERFKIERHNQGLFNIKLYIKNKLKNTYSKQNEIIISIQYTD